ncbi:glycosyltransferase family 4 protein [Citrobacter sedlakii]|uniref:glycosyltransferase family 4 protein n=1 Tax=Citrobacter sedlakii TaxID=67826 RepID=UPI00388EE2FC
MIVYIVSLNADGGQGGVERVAAQQKKILTDQGAHVVFLDKNYFFITRLLKNTKLLLILYPVIVSVYLWLRKLFNNRSFTIAHGYCAPFYINDLLIAHGNMKCYYQTISQHKIKFLSGSGLLAFYEKCAGSFSKKIWAVSKKVKTEWIEYYSINANKIDVVRNYIDLSKFTGQQSNDQEYVAFVGRLEKGKGVSELIDICKRLPEVKFYFVSSIVPPPELNELSNVTVNVGVAYSKMPDVFKKAKMLILPSSYEGFELVTIEALCCGTPVVGYNVGAISELYSEQFPGVFMVTNKEMLIEKIKHIASLDFQEYAALRMNTYSLREHFSEQHYNNLMASVYNEKKKKNMSYFNKFL